MRKDAENALINQLRKAVDAGIVKEPFTNKDVDIWALEKKIVKSNNKPYTKKYLKTILYNSVDHDRPTKNKNSIQLYMNIAVGDVRYYWFIR